MSNRKELYRDPDKGRIAGVCAGISDYFNFELWLVRIIFVSGFLLSGSLFFVGYIAAWFILEQKPKNTEQQPTPHAPEVKFKVWQKGEPPRKALQELKNYLSGLDERIQRMESHVTSPEFTVSREINKL